MPEGEKSSGVFRTAAGHHLRGSPFANHNPLPGSYRVTPELIADSPQLVQVAAHSVGPNSFAMPASRALPSICTVSQMVYQFVHPHKSFIAFHRRVPNLELNQRLAGFVFCWKLGNACGVPNWRRTSEITIPESV